MENIISLRNIVVEFDGEQILKNIDLDIKDKEFVTFLGPSGCGKTTTLRIIGGFLTPNSGDVMLEGKRINDLPPHKRDVNTVFQRYALFPHLNVYENIAFGLRIKKLPEKEIQKRVGEMLELVNLRGYEKRTIHRLSGGQQQRVAIARALVNRPKILLLDEPLGALDLKLRKEMQIELRKIQQQLELTFVYVTHDQEEALTMSDTVVVMNNGHIQQIGSPTDIYNEPVNAFVADFIGESNILNGTMVEDRLVRFMDTEFKCVDEGFGNNVPVDVVIRPEDIYIMAPTESAMLHGRVSSCIFKGVHYEMTVQLPNGYELMVQDYNAFEPESEVSLIIKPSDIHVMKKERTCNTFEAVVVDETHIDMLGATFECMPHSLEKGTEVKVEVDFDKIELTDDKEDGMLEGDVRLILYKGNHYHLTIVTDEDDYLYVDTNDVWDDGDMVGINILPGDMRIIHN